MTYGFYCIQIYCAFARACLIYTIPVPYISLYSVRIAVMYSTSLGTPLSYLSEGIVRRTVLLSDPDPTLIVNRWGARAIVHQSLQAFILLAAFNVHAVVVFVKQNPFFSSSRYDLRTIEAEL